MGQNGAHLLLTGRDSVGSSPVPQSRSPGTPTGLASSGLGRTTKCTTNGGMGQNGADGRGAAESSIVHRQPSLGPRAGLTSLGLGTNYEMVHKWWDNSWGPSKTGWEALGGTFDSG